MKTKYIVLTINCNITYINMYTYLVGNKRNFAAYAAGWRAEGEGGGW